MNIKKQLRLIPTKIYKIQAVALFAAALNAISVYLSAMLLQLYTYYLGFTNIDQINQMILPLSLTGNMITFSWQL